MKKILLIISVLIFIIITIPVLGKNIKDKDYTCIDKEGTELPPPKLQTVINNFDDSYPALCSQGKVPKMIVNEKPDKEKIIDNMKRFPHAESPVISATDCTTYGACYDWAESSSSISSLGASAILTQHNPNIDQYNGYHSLAEIGVQAYDGDYVEIGWRKANGDNTKLFTFWWKNGIPQCYNGCGWVQYSIYYYPGMQLSEDTVGTSYAIQYSNNNWWVLWKNEWIGYYPGSLWDGQFVEGNRVLYYGEVASTIPQTTTDMGNGLWASNTNAGKISSELYLNTNNAWINANTYKTASNPNLYSVMSTSSDSMRYGGPGYISPVSITVVSPNGGENWQTGSTQTINWSSTGNPGQYVNIDLLKGGGPNSIIVSNVPNSGSYSWTISPNQMPGTDYIVRIVSTTNSAYTDSSDNDFTISSSIPLTGTISGRVSKLT